MSLAPDLNLSDDQLIAAHERLHGDITNPAVVQAHHLVTAEMTSRGLAHGHEDDEWGRAVIEIMRAEHQWFREAVNGMPLDVIDSVRKELGDPVTVDTTTLLTVDGYTVRFDKAEGLKVGDFVSWNSSGGTARGRIERIIREGRLDVPGSDFTITASEDDPAALIRIYRPFDGGWRAVNTRVGHKVRTLNQIEPLPMTKAEGYTPPDGVREAARRALRWIEEGHAGDGFTAVGRGRARQLADGQALSMTTIKRMYSYFARHGAQRAEHDALDDGKPTPWRVAWDAWGGDAGRTWVKGLIDRMEKSTDVPLDPVQEALYRGFESVSEQIGKFDQGVGALGSHYMGGEDNPFHDKGLNCANCVFYEGGQGCEIVKGQIDPMGLCKFWIIPEGLLEEEGPDYDDEEAYLAGLTDMDKAFFASVSKMLDDGLDPYSEILKRGNPEPLRDYWRAGGKGKISWGAGGDFTACVAAVSKYMTSEEAKGYCAIRHREVTGMWPGDKRNRMNKGEFEPVIKHPGNHNQKVHAGSRGAGSDGGSDLPELAANNKAKKGQYSDEAIREASRVRAKAEELEPGTTRIMQDLASKHGGELEGLQYRLKGEESLARKIDADSRDFDGDRVKAADNLSDAIRYTMVIDDDTYTDGVDNTIKALEADGYSVRAKNFWKFGDDYQGINAKATKDGVTLELQFHTRASLDFKEGRTMAREGSPFTVLDRASGKRVPLSLHAIYENYRTADNNRDKWRDWQQMVRIADSVPRPRNYEKLLTIGTLTTKVFEPVTKALRWINQTGVGMMSAGGTE